jgi:diguanylate cyclase (GGDEF)-like protein/PAS domain S-box-containing protein
MTLYPFILGITILLQITAAGVALRLIFLKRTRLAWTLLLVVMLLVASLELACAANYSSIQTSLIETLAIPVGLVVAVSSLASLLALNPVYRAGQRAEEAFQLLVEDSLQGLVIYQSGRFVFANRAFAQLTGFSVEELLSFNDTDIQALFPPDERDHLMVYLHAFPQDLSDIRQEVRLVSQDGVIAWAEMFIRPTDYQGHAAVQATFININERRHYQQALHESEQRHRLISSMISDYVYAARIVTRETTAIEWVSGAFERITGRTVSQVQSMRTGWIANIHPDDRHLYVFAFNQALKDDDAIAEYRIFTPDGRAVWLRDYIHAVRDGSTGEVERLLGAVQDINAQKQAENALRTSEIRWRSLVENAPALITTVTVNGIVLSINRGGEHGLPGLSVGSCLYDIFPPSEDEKLRTAVEYVFQSGRPTDLETRHIGEDGGVHWFQTHAGPIHDEEAVQSVILLSTDITTRKYTEEKLRFFSTHDALTGLYNRAFFEGEIERLVSSRLFPVSVVIADVNGLKQTNDLFGHAAGDDLLRAVAHVLRDSFRDEDVICRLGGDEFAVLLAQTDRVAAEAAIERVRGRVQDYNAGQNPFPISIALGAASAKMGDGLNETIKLADDQMYADKTRQKLTHRI